MTPFDWKAYENYVETLEKKLENLCLQTKGFNEKAKVIECYRMAVILGNLSDMQNKQRNDYINKWQSEINLQKKQHADRLRPSSSQIKTQKPLQKEQ